jgi:integrase
MATLKFILRKSSRGVSYTGKLCARIIHSRRVCVQGLELSLYPCEWDESGQQILLPDEAHERYPYLQKATALLVDYRKSFTRAIGLLEVRGHYTVNDIRVGNRRQRALTSLRGFSLYLSRSLSRSGQERTARAYLTASRALISFNKGADVPLRHINACMMKEFESYLKERGKAMNTVSYYVRMLRAIYRKAVREGLIDARRENPFEGVFTGFCQTRKRALDINQLRSLNSLDFSVLLDEDGFVPALDGIAAVPSKELYQSWRYFFFCFHARGMSFVDMAYLRKENIRQGVISYYRKKTGQKIEVTLSPCLQRIIDSFSGEVCHSPYVFPVIRDSGKSLRLQYENGLRRQNRLLKRLSSLAGIGVKLSTHVTRHSWATTGKKQRLPLWVISEGLGHSSEKMTYTYLACFDRSTLDKASRKIDLAVAGRKDRHENTQSVL